MVTGEAKEHGLKVHLDGARLFNAQAATGIPARDWCEYADTVSRFARPKASALP
jgi:threonine aldolase